MTFLFTREADGTFEYVLDDQWRHPAPRFAATPPPIYIYISFCYIPPCSPIPSSLVFAVLEHDLIERRLCSAVGQPPSPTPHQLVWTQSLTTPGPAGDLAGALRAIKEAVAELGCSGHLDLGKPSQQATPVGAGLLIWQRAEVMKYFSLPQAKASKIGCKLAQFGHFGLA